MCRTLACLLVALSVSSAGFADEKPDAKELLKTYQKTVESMKQFGIEAEMRNYDGTADPAAKGRLTHKHQMSFHSDGERWRIWDKGGIVEEPGGVYERETLVGREVLICTVDLRPSLHGDFWRLLGYLDVEKGKIQAQHIWDCGMLLFGVSYLDNDQPIWKVMLDAPRLEVDEKPETVGGALTYRVTSEGPLGIHSVWLDPKAGCLPRKIEIRKTKDKGLPEPPPLSERILRRRPDLRNRPVRLEFTERFENITLGSAGKTPVMMGFDQVATSKLSDGSGGTSRREFRVKKFSLDKNGWPEFALEQHFFIPDGTRVQVMDAPRVNYVWNDGKFVKAD